jgi:hypothetical protein
MRLGQPISTCLNRPCTNRTRWQSRCTPTVRSARPGPARPGPARPGPARASATARRSAGPGRARLSPRRIHPAAWGRAPTARARRLRAGGAGRASGRLPRLSGHRAAWACQARPTRFRVGLWPARGAARPANLKIRVRVGFRGLRGPAGPRAACRPGSGPGARAAALCGHRAALRLPHRLGRPTRTADSDSDARWAPCRASGPRVTRPVSVPSQPAASCGIFRPRAAAA